MPKQIKIFILEPQGQGIRMHAMNESKTAKNEHLLDVLSNNLLINNLSKILMPFIFTTGPMMKKVH